MVKFLMFFLFLFQFSFSQSIDSGVKGDGMSRTGFVNKYKDFKYPENVLSAWKKDKEGISPKLVTGLLSNPYRNDGTALSYGVVIPSDFNGRIPVFTYGNWWPVIGSKQTAPLTYKDLTTDTGAIYINGKVEQSTAITRKGIDRVKIVNKTPYSYLVSAGVFPGNEQPGQVMTIIGSNGSGQLPIPPKDWWEFNFNDKLISAVPEVYSSVAGLNPLDAPGWKHSSWSPKYNGGVQSKDFGTPGFAYVFSSLFGRNDDGFDLTKTLFSGFHTNEGYDPLVSGDPGYGCAFYIDDVLQAVMDISLTGTYTAKAILLAQSKHHPGSEKSAFDDGISHLKSIIGVAEHTKAEIHYITHDYANILINTNSIKSNWTKVEKIYQSNTKAKVKEEKISVTTLDLKTANTCSDGIKNGTETSVDCGGSCASCGVDKAIITGKFLPDGPGTLLSIGQDVTSIDNFSLSMGTIPAVLSGYTGITDLNGMDTGIDYGSGLQHFSNLATNYPKSGLLLAVYLVGSLDDINAGRLDGNMDLLIDKLVALDRPIYLRWGYEFDGQHNGYDPVKFVAAWKRMYNKIQGRGTAKEHIAMVWHSGAFCGGTKNTHGNHPVISWYPGSDYVDMMGISIFTPQDCNYTAQNVILDFARTENKAVIIAESTPQGYDVNDQTKASVSGTNRGVTSSKPIEEIWNEWYQPFFNYIEDNKDVIRMATYINADWNSQGFWDAPYDMGYWGDSRVESNPWLKNAWNNEINTIKWVKASTELFQIIGYKQSKTPVPTCSDGIKNGDEEDIDCGGSCSPCVLSTKIIEQETLGIYPNPSTDLIVLKGVSVQNKTKYKIYDTASRLIKKGSGTKINISNLTNGIYLLLTEKGDRKVFIKQ